MHISMEACLAFSNNWEHVRRMYLRRTLSCSGWPGVLNCVFILQPAPCSFLSCSCHTLCRKMWHTKSLATHFKYMKYGHKDCCWKLLLHRTWNTHTRTKTTLEQSRRCKRCTCRTIMVPIGTIRLWVRRVGVCVFLSTICTNIKLFVHLFPVK